MTFELLCMAAVTAAHEPLWWTWLRSVPYDLQTIFFVNTQDSLLVGGVIAREPIADVGLIEAT